MQINKPILTEAIDLTAFHNDCAELLTKINDLIKLYSNRSSQGDNHDNYQKLINDTKKLSDDINKIKDPAIIKSKAKAYVNNLKQILQIIDPGYTADDNETRQAFNNVIEAANNNNFTEQSVDELKSFINTIASLATNLMKQGDLIGGKLQPGKAVAILQVIYKDVKIANDLNSEASIDGTISDGIEALFDSYPSDINNESQAIEFIRTGVELHNGAFGTKTAEYAKSSDRASDLAGEAGDEINTENAKNIDWDAKYAETSDKQSFWDLYFTSYWGQYADTVESFGSSFKQECEVLGFTPEANPFIGYLKEYLVNKKYPITRQHYIAIHNSIAADNGGLEKANLNQIKSPMTDHTNFLWCKNFFTKNGKDAESYIKSLYNIKKLDLNELKDLRVDSLAPNIQAAFEKLRTYFSDAKSMETLVYIIFYEHISIDNLLKVDAPKSVDPTKDVKSAILRPASDVKKLITILYAANGKTETKAWNDGSTSDLIKAIKDKVKDTDKDKLKAYAGKVALVLSAAVFGESDLNDASSKYTWFASATVTLQEQIKIVKMIDNCGGKYTASQVKTILQTFDDDSTWA